MKSMIVFVVDKNPIHRSLVKYHLNVNKFFNVHTFQTSDECMYRLQKNMVPDFLITDYNPSEHIGFEFLRNVKEISSSTQIIFFSSFDDPILAVRLLDAGASDYIAKTSKLDVGITDLIKNVKYLSKEKVLY
ncbi:MAG: response regulator [Bacteroidota bacterium]